MIGDIYKLTCKTSGKCYVGQSKKFMGRDDDKWGYIKRWKTHVYEALYGKKDHCTLLNNAIRKYGKDDFEVELLCECLSKEEMDEKERHFISECNSLVPKGYNLEKGGRSKRVFSKQARENMKTGQKNRRANEKTKNYMSSRHVGMRTTKKRPRKHPEDNELPKYVTAFRNNDNIITRYKIKNFPIGVNEKKYINETFSIKNYNSVEETLNATKERLTKLKEEYKHIHGEIEEYQNLIVSSHTFAPKKNDKKLHELPEYVFPVYNDKRIKLGYFVDGVKKNDGTKYPVKQFTSKKANKWDLNDAVRFIEQCKNQNEDEKFKVPPNLIPGRHRFTLNEMENPLPKSMYFCRNKNNILTGFCFTLCGVENGKHYSRSFTNPRQTLKEKFDACYSELQKAKKKYNIQDSNEPILPKYVNKVNIKGTHKGYKFIIKSIIKEDGRKLQRFFTNPKFTMEERLKQCIEELNKVKKQHNIN